MPKEDNTKTCYSCAWRDLEDTGCWCASSPFYGQEREAKAKTCECFEDDEL